MKFFQRFRRSAKPAPPAPVEHSHRWRPIAVNQGTLAGQAASDGKPYNSTEILQVCDCGNFFRDIVFGHWTLEQVQAGGLSRDVEELRRMASL